MTLLAALDLLGTLVFAFSCALFTIALRLTAMRFGWQAPRRSSSATRE